MIVTLLIAISLPAFAALRSMAQISDKNGQNLWSILTSTDHIKIYSVHNQQIGIPETDLTVVNSATRQIYTVHVNPSVAGGIEINKVNEGVTSLVRLKDQINIQSTVRSGFDITYDLTVEGATSDQLNTIENVLAVKLINGKSSWKQEQISWELIERLNKALQ